MVRPGNEGENPGRVPGRARHRRIAAGRVVVGEDVTKVPAAAARPIPGRTGIRVLLALLLVLPPVGLGVRPASAIENSWTARSADLTGAADLASGGRGITVAVLDSWVDGRHP